MAERSADYQKTQAEYIAAAKEHIAAEAELKRYAEEVIPAYNERYMAAEASGDAAALTAIQAEGAKLEAAVNAAYARESAASRAETNASIAYNYAGGEAGYKHFPELLTAHKANGPQRTW